MCSSHRHYLENQDMTTLRNRAFAIDEVVLEVVDQILQRNDRPEQGFKSCQGILSLERKHGAKALIWACKMAIELYCFTYRYITRIAAHPYSGEQSELNHIPLPLHCRNR